MLHVSSEGRGELVQVSIIQLSIVHQKWMYWEMVHHVQPCTQHTTASVALTLVTACTSAPLDKSSLTTSSWPSSDASCRAVTPYYKRSESHKNTFTHVCLYFEAYWTRIPCVTTHDCVARATRPRRIHVPMPIKKLGHTCTHTQTDTQVSFIDID